MIDLGQKTSTSTKKEFIDAIDAYSRETNLDDANAGAAAAL